MLNYRKNIFLDDERHPFDISWGDINYSLNSWYLVRNYDAFLKAVEEYWPDMISMDNDLGEEKEGYDCLKWLIEYAMDHDLILPKIYFHSKNEVAVDNMKVYLNSFNRSNVKKD